MGKCMRAFCNTCSDFHMEKTETDQILSINPFANLFVFGGFDVHHNDSLTSSGGTDTPGEF